MLENRKTRLVATAGSPKTVDFCRVDASEFATLPLGKQAQRIVERFGVSLPIATVIASLHFGETRP